MKTIRFGIIGLGFFGEHHAEVLADMPGAELAALCTRRPERLAAMAERFRVPKRYTDYRELLQDRDIDAVTIVTHVNDHADVAVAALEAGKHVFLEKPMAGTVADCDRIMAAVRQARGRFMVGHICRFDPRVALAQQAVAEGRLGDIVSLHATRNLPARIGAAVLDKISPLLGDGIHDVDLMLWLTRSRVKTVYAQTHRVRQFLHPDLGWAMFRFETGAIGVIETVWMLPDQTPFTIDARLEVIGTKGALYIDCGHAGLAIHGATGAALPDTGYWPHCSGRQVGALRNEFEYFVACLRAGCPPERITPEESRAAVQAICAAEESAATGQVTTI